MTQIQILAGSHIAFFFPFNIKGNGRRNVLGWPLIGTYNVLLLLPSSLVAVDSNLIFTIMYAKSMPTENRTVSIYPLLNSRTPVVQLVTT